MTGYSSDSVLLLGGHATVWTPRTLRPNTHGIVLFPGQSNPRMYADGGTQLASMALAAGLASAGIPLVTCEFYGNSWATDPVIDTAVPAVRALLAARFPTMLTDQVGVLGTSMGGGAAARLTQLHPDQVAAAVGCIPAYDPKSVYIANNVGDAAMEAAWGFSGLANFPDALDLGPKAALASTVPLMTAYSSDDDAIPSQNVIDYHALAGGDIDNLINLGPQGHTIGPVGQLPIDTVVEFFLTHGV